MRRSIKPFPAKNLNFGKSSIIPNITSNTPLMSTNSYLKGKNGGTIFSYRCVRMKWSIPTPM